MKQPALSLQRLKGDSIGLCVYLIRVTEMSNYSGGGYGNAEKNTAG